MALQTFTAGQVLTAAQVTALQSNDFNQTVTVETADYTLVAADKGTRVVMNAATAKTITVDDSIFNAGDTLFIHNIGAGVCTITAGTATVSTAGSLALPTNAGGTLFFTSAGVAIFFPTVASSSASGLELVSSLSFSGVFSQSVNNVFTSTYDNYYLELDYTWGNNVNDCYIKLRASGTDKSTNYTSTGTSLNGTSVGSYGTGTTTFMYIMQGTNGLMTSTFNIFRPNISGPTTIMANSTRSTDAHRYINSAGQTENYQADGFTIFWNVAATGKLKVFGVNQ